VAETLQLLADGAVAGDGDPGFRPVYGFLSHQTTQPSDDPEPAPPLPPPEGDAGSGTSIVVIDTGLDDAWPWRAAVDLVGRETDPLDGLAPDPAGQRGPFLGRAAGHATFIAGVIAQVAPGARLTVLRAANTEGQVDERGLAARLRAVASTGPDLIVLSCGGYAIRLGSFGTPGGAGEPWLQPLLLRRAIDRVLANGAGTVVVCSAGNSDSIDRCFPAAFAVGRDAVVSVAALEAGGRRYCHSNYGDWVRASAIGARVRSTYVGGREHPANDPDGFADTFTAGSFAEWSGTSFAAPGVAARIAVLLSAMRAQLGPSVTARQAWAVLEATSRAAVDWGCGKEVPVTGLAHG
jgi:subtilisin family serine protease